MATAPWIECSLDSEWRTLLILGVVFFVLYTVGVPILFGALLVKFRHRIHEHSVEDTIGFLYEGYRHPVFYFEVRNSSHRRDCTCVPVLTLDDSIDGVDHAPFVSGHRVVNDRLRNLAELHGQYDLGALARDTALGQSL